MEQIVIEQKMRELSRKIGYRFTDIGHLARAMCVTAMSRNKFVNESQATLGDAVLGLIIADRLFKQGLDEAQMSRERSSLVNNRLLFALTNELGIYKYAYSDKYFYEEAEQRGQRLPHFEDHTTFLEAIVGAVYLDSGYDVARKWVTDWLYPRLTRQRIKLGRQEAQKGKEYKQNGR